MAIKSKDELLASVNAIIGENPDDAGIALIEDITDTLDNNGSENWKQRYEENDAAWRKKYRDRFMNPPEQKEAEQEEPAKPRTFKDLFKEK